MIFVESLFIFAIIAILWMVVMLAIFKKLNKARIKGVLLIFLAFIAVAVVLSIVGHFLEWHESNEFCGELCHSMDNQYDSYTNPEYNAYMETHLENDVTCAQCHSGPGFQGQVNSYLGVPKELVGEYSPHIILEEYDPNDMGGHVPSENCLKGCHEEAGMDWKFVAPKPVGEGYLVVDGRFVWNTTEIYHPDTVQGTNLEELERLESCQDCHDPRANSFGITSEACGICHDIDHEELEHHGESTCSMVTCHDIEAGIPDTAPPRPKLVGHNVVGEHCMVCHYRDHPDDAFVPDEITNSLGVTLNVNDSFCADCHQDAYNGVTDPDSKHSFSCNVCHSDHKKHTDCAGSCHSTIQHGTSDPYNNCKDCHNIHNP